MQSLDVSLSIFIFLMKKLIEESDPELGRKFRFPDQTPGEI